MTASAPKLDDVLSRALLRAESFSPNATPTAAARQRERLSVPALLCEQTRITQDDVVGLILEGEVDRPTLEALGVTVNTQVGQVTTAEAPLRAVAALVGLPKVRHITIESSSRLQTDVSVPAIAASGVWGGPPPNYSPQGSTGKNVVIGIVDTGIDVNHQDFRTNSGTRIAWLWDQGIPGAPPSGFTYGSEYASASINSGNYTSGDHDGHGTLLAGIAAGNGRATGHGVPMYSYMGVAPQADLVIVKMVPLLDGSYPDGRVIDGVSYVFRKAAMLGRPAVVLVALGKQSGPHDGSDPLDLAISALGGTGKIVVAPAGNDNGKFRHAEWTSTGSNQVGNATVSIGSYVPSMNAWDCFIAEAWYDAGVNYSVSIVTPTGQVVGPVARGMTTSVQTPSGVVEISNGTYMSANGSYRANLRVYRGNISWPQVAPGIWTYRFQAKTSGTHRVDLWMTTYVLGSTSPTLVQGKTDARLVTSPATANGVIAVGAYSTKVGWVDVTGAHRSYTFAVLNDIARFSSPGPRRDGILLPHITAPGYGVAGALSSQSGASEMYVVQDGVHCMQYGTSVAAAHVAGGVALMLQARPDLTASQVIAELQRNARHDSWTGAVPNATWGSGKLQLRPLTNTAVPDEGASRDQFALRLAPNPAKGPAQFQFSLPVGDLLDVPRVRLRILDVRGRQVAVLTGSAATGIQRLVWDGAIPGGSKAPSGVYWARLEVGPRHAVTKFIRIP